MHPIPPTSTRSATLYRPARCHSCSMREGSSLLPMNHTNGVSIFKTASTRWAHCSGHAHHPSWEGKGVCDHGVRSVWLILLPLNLLYVSPQLLWWYVVTGAMMVESGQLIAQ